jgi:hypothetical protein
VLHAAVAPEAHAPWPAQLPSVQVHDALQVSVSVPQLPHASDRIAPGAHTPCPVQLPSVQAHELLQVSVSVPQLPHASDRIAPGAHTPCPVQVPAGTHAQAAVQVKVAIPHIVPHACSVVAPGLHTPVQAEHMPLVHTFDAQSLFAPQTLLSGQLGAHVGDAHFMLLQTPVAQSLLVEHA